MTTKEQERNILAQIEALINSTESGSYIRMAFAGCVKMAHENIEFDFGNSYPDMIEFKDKQLEELRKENAELRDNVETLKSKESLLRIVVDERDTVSATLDTTQELLSETERKLAEKDTEIIRLKAKLYDLIIGKEN